VLENTLFIKKSLSFFIEPLGMVITLFIIALYYFYIKNERKAERYFLLSFFLLLLFSYPPFSNYLISSLESNYTQYDYKHKDIKYIHVLGNAHNTDKKQPLSSHLSSAGTKRVLEGVIIYKKVPGSKIIFTGYAGDTNRANSEMNADLAVALDVNRSDIICNPKPKDTEEEALFCKSVVGDEPCIVVTSAAHMPRAMQLFKKYGVHAIAAPTDFLQEEPRGYLRAPNVKALMVSTLALHEYIGALWIKIKALLGY